MTERHQLAMHKNITIICN